MEQNKDSPFGVFKIASAYIGTVVGAGFASGQEILRFFIAHGLAGILGIALSALLFFFVGYSVLMLGRNLNAKSQLEIIRHTNGSTLGSAIDALITLFLFGGLAAMLSGAGAIFREQFALPPVFGMLVMAAAVLLTVISGTRGVINAISYVVPFLIVSVLFIAIGSLIENPVSSADIELSRSLGGATSHWLLSAVNYASYNVIISISVLTSIGACTASKKKLFYGALLGAAGLAVGLGAIYICLITNIAEICRLEIPMIEVAGKISAFVKILFAFVLFCEIYTTAVGNLYGFVCRMSKNPSPALIAGTTAAALIAAQFGFSNMVKYFYPVIGYGGILFFAGVFYSWITKTGSFR
jgi:uncharacterized membrane protein YkvI